MESYKIENLSFTYPNSREKSLSNISFTVKQGEFITLCGKSGCGKTTLLRLLKPSLAPHGTVDGSIFFCGTPVSSLDIREQSMKIGFVLQNPENQVVTDKVWHELAFGLENIGCPTVEIRARVSEMAAFFGIDNWFYKNVSELSGGQKQILNLASVMVMQPSVLVLDEPTSMLDPIAAEEFFKVLEKINRELGVTVILSEHRLENAFSVSDRIIVMECGKIIFDAPPCKIGRLLKNSQSDMYFALPAPMQIHTELDFSSEGPVSVREGRVWLDGFVKTHDINKNIAFDEPHSLPEDFAIEIKDAHFRYEKNLPDVLKGLDIKVKKGEFFAMLGGNGTGKSTLLSLICGINTAYRGSVKHKGSVGLLPQHVQTVFTKKTVYAELTDVEKDNDRISHIAKLCHVQELFDKHPYDLSGGEMQRVAFAKILLLNPDVLLLDEPTKGMDAIFKAEFAEIIHALTMSKVTVVMVSHDIEFCAEYADRCALFFDGNITSHGTPREFFAGKSFYTTAVNRMAREYLPRAILINDVISAFYKEREKRQKSNVIYKRKESANPPKEVASAVTKRPLTRRTLLSMLSILLLIPLTVFVGVYYLGDRKYYFISLLIILETLIPFFAAFERRKPKARELAVIGVLCGIGVAGRAAFFMLPQFKPVMAIVIISGVCLGGEVGFLIGAVTAFLSNFFFGQGPWTPWQMFAFGIIGFLAGVLHRKGFLPKRKIPLCIFGFIAALVIYGGIMNPASVLIWQATPKAAMFLSAGAMGLPFDLIHAISSAFFLYFAAEPMMEKLTRIKEKYGIVE